MATLVKRGKVWHIQYHDRRLGKNKMFTTRTADRSAALRMKKDLEAKLQLNIAEHGFTKVNQKTASMDDLVYLFFLGKAPSKSRLQQFKTTVAYWREAVGDKDVRRITELDCVKYTEHLRTVKKLYKDRKREPKPLTLNTISTYQKNIFVLFQFAVKKKLMQDNPMQQPIRRQLREVKPVTPAHLEAILNYFRQKTEQQYYYFVKFIYLAALRISEALAAEVTDIDTADQVLYIRNIKGKRTDAIPLIQELEDLFNEMELPKSGKLFPRWNTRHSCKKFWQSAMQRLGYDYGFHQLRKARGTDLANAGVSPLFVQKYMRHRDLRTTQSYYIKLDNQIMKDNIEQMTAKSQHTHAKTVLTVKNQAV